MIKAVVFDWGGVLVGWRQIFENFATEKQIEYDELMKAFWEFAPDSEIGKFGVDEYYQKVMGSVGLIEMWEEIRNKMPGELKPIKVTFELLKELKQKGKYKLALLTNTQAGLVDDWDKVSGFKFKQYFDLIVDSSVEAVRKPDPEIYQIVCDRLNLKPKECLFIDDLIENIEGAKKVGFATVHFTEPKKGVAEIRCKLKLV